MSEARSPGRATFRLTPLDQLREHPDNPRKINRERLDQLKRSIAADPEMLQARPLIALKDGTVIAGNMRLRAARELGWETILVYRVELDETTARLWMLRDNNSFGDWDLKPLAEMLTELAKIGTDLDLAGFGSFELDELLDAMRPVGGEDDAPPVPAEPRSRAGESYELGPHMLFCADSRYPIPNMPEVAAVVTDPPYGVDYSDKANAVLGHGGRVDSRIANDDLTGEALEHLLGEALMNAIDAAQPGAPIYVFHSEATSPTFRRALETAGWRYAQTLVWAKNHLVLGRQDYQWQHEPIIYGWKPGAAHRWYADATQTTIVLDDETDPRKLTKKALVEHVLELRQAAAASTLIREPKPARSDLHPTMKPVRLLERLIRNSTRKGDVIFDPFAGAGATMIAADKLGRRAFMVELDPGYCDVIRDRWEAWNAPR